MSLRDAERAIPAVVHMISGCEDKQTSADVSNVASFQLPDPAGRAGGALTAALLNVTYADHADTGKDLSWKEVLLKTRTMLKKKGFQQIPQLSSSRPTHMTNPFSIVPERFSGTRRAVMVGINYVGHKPGELRGCHNDVHNMMEYIKKCHGFQEENITVLMDDGRHPAPTYKNIMNAYQRIARQSQPGDAVFIHYSGHGCSIPDDDGDEEDDGMDEALCPIDFKTAGVIRDDDVFSTLIAPMPKGVTVTCVMDCCHSGTILDLPYTFLANGHQQEMELDEEFDFGPFLEMAQALAKAGLEQLKNFDGLDQLKAFRAKNKKQRTERRKKRKDRFMKCIGLS